MAATASLKKLPSMKELMAAKPIIQKKPICLKKWMVGCYSSLQKKWHTTLNNEWLQVVLWKKYTVFTKIWYLK